MSIGNDTNFYYDLHSLDALKNSARKDAGSALKDVAKQFEGIFVKMMLKSMRQASIGEDISSSDNEKFYRDMYDDQLVVEMGKSGSIGLADIIVKQLQNSVPMRKTNPLMEMNKANSEHSESPVINSIVTPSAFDTQNALARYRDMQSQVTSMMDETPFAPIQSENGNSEPIQIPELQKSELDASSPVAFVRSVWSSATKAAEDLGVSPVVLVAQAALETGWGKGILKNNDGSSSYNLFNIKASRRWQGERLSREVSEIIEGVKVKEQSDFRSYANVDASFSDYVKYLRSNPRYESAVANSDDRERFVDELQRAGYATDPEYAKKIKRVMNSEEMKSALTQIHAMSADASAAVGG